MYRIFLLLAFILCSFQSAARVSDAAKELLLKLIPAQYLASEADVMGKIEVVEWKEKADGTKLTTSEMGASYVYHGCCLKYYTNQRRPAGYSNFDYKFNIENAAGHNIDTYAAAKKFVRIFNPELDLEHEYCLISRETQKQCDIFRWRRMLQGFFYLNDEIGVAMYKDGTLFTLRVDEGRRCSINEKITADTALNVLKRVITWRFALFNLIEAGLMSSVHYSYEQPSKYIVRKNDFFDGTFIYPLKSAFFCDICVKDSNVNRLAWVIRVNIDNPDVIKELHARGFNAFIDAETGELIGGCYGFEKPVPVDKAEDAEKKEE
ncbi:MAG: hypothetical protein PHQ23_09460 [Candidatus Wallbacteria bacterium]|nr:hypothetical protein [Candidatus Wallbacteria bacterium]